MTTKITIGYKDHAEDIVEKVNEALASRGLRFDDAGGDRDAGTEDYALVCTACGQEAPSVAAASPPSERAAVVAFVRANGPRFGVAESEWVADAIEKGEHLGQVPCTATTEINEHDEEDGRTAPCVLRGPHEEHQTSEADGGFKWKILPPLPPPPPPPSIALSDQGGDLVVSRDGRRLVGFYIRHGEEFTWGKPANSEAGYIEIGGLRVLGITVRREPS